MQEYESLKAGKFQPDELKQVADLPTALNNAWTAQGLSQRDLADRIGLKEQIQRYEATDYASASLSRIKEIISALGVETGNPV